MKAVSGGLLVATLLASPAFAESPSGTWNGLSDRFQIDTGYFRLTADTQLRYNGAPGSGDIHFENDLGVDENVDTFWIDGTWRVGRRHQVKLAYTRLDRGRADYALERDFTWGGEDYKAGLSASTSTSSDILGGYYRFAAFRNDRFEIGPTVGVGYLWLNAGVDATGTIAGASRTIRKSASTGSITGALGGYANGWLTKRLVARGDFLYIKVSPGETDASVTDWRVGADYYFFRNAGVGVQYKYNTYTYDRGVLSEKLGGQIAYKGFQVFLTFQF